MQINIEAIYVGLSYPQHLIVARSLAIVQQQMESTKNMVVVQREFKKIVILCNEIYPPKSGVMKALLKWKIKFLNNPYWYLRAILASEFDSMSDEDYFREGNIYRDIETRYLSEEEFKASNSALN
ncbi:MAG: hypothetical protein WCW84_05105 [Sulfurimonas sp.]|jgi:hypothetical protein